MDVCADPADPCHACALCRGEDLRPGRLPVFAHPAARRARASFDPIIPPKRAVSLLPAGVVPRKRARGARAPAASSAPHAVAEQRLGAFLALMALLDTAPWASVVFDINDRMLRVLTATHLHLIVGKSVFKACDRPALLRLIEPDPARSLDGLGNVVWVTNRQQGKTSTLGKFIAALALASPVGGDLINVYATSLDRSNELVKAAKAYIYWCMNDQPAYRHVSIKKANNTTFIVSNGLADNIIVARPKAPDSCRGDAPEACFFDEVGFVGEAFWYKFAFPLLQVALRVATCTTTPPPKSGFFETFLDQVKARNAAGDRFFYLENHSLSCQPCVDAGEAHRCCHNLRFVPPWKSMLRFTAMRKLIPRRQLETFQTEVYGVLRAANATYFPPPLVDAAFDRERAATITPDGAVWVGLDPAGHSVSDMGLCAVAFCHGIATIVGCASVNVARSDVAGVLALVNVFLRRLRKIVPAPIPLVPVVEVNNNEVYAHSLTKAFDRFPPIFMPFTADNFSICVAPGIGVRTTHETKMQMVQHGYLAFVEGRVAVAAATAAVCKADTTPRAVAVDPHDHLEELKAQLKRMQDNDKGEITGKTEGGDNDDMCVAFLLALYWSACARAAQGIKGHV